MSMIKRNSNEQRETVIAMALETAEGRTALAQAMVEPIKTSLMYQAIGRKLFMVDELPQGALARYERDVAVKSYVIPKRGGVPSAEVEAEELLVPTIELAAHPQIRLNEIRQRRFYIVDRAQVRAKDSLQRQEDTEVFKVLNAGVPTDQSISVSGTLQPENINLALTLIEEHELMRGRDIVELVRGELAQLRKEFRMTQQMNLWQMGTQIHPSLVPLRQALQEAPIPAALKALLVDSIHQKDTPESALQEIRAHLLHSIGDAQRALPDSGVHVFSGFSGSGKSMAVARLAQHASSKYGAEQVAVISYQDIKPGAWNQTQLLCAQSGADCFRATNAAALQLLLEELQARRLILIDTSGVQIGERLQEIQAVAQQLDMEMSMHAVLPADASQATIAKLNQMTQISWTSMVVSKLDESTQPWALLQFFIEQPLGVSMISRGERMADWSAKMDASEFVDVGLSQLSLATVPPGASQLHSAVARATAKIAQLANDGSIQGAMGARQPVGIHS